MRARCGILVIIALASLALGVAACSSREVSGRQGGGPSVAGTLSTSSVRTPPTQSDRWAVRAIGSNWWGEPPTSRPEGLAWLGSSESSSGLFAWSRTTSQTTELAGYAADAAAGTEAVDFNLVWAAGRYYWLRVTSEWKDDLQDSELLGTEILSIAPGEPTATVVASAFDISELQATNSRLVWLQRPRGSRRWRLLSSGAGLRIGPKVIEAVKIPPVPRYTNPENGPPVDVRLSDSFLVWAADGSRTVHMLPLEANGGLSPTRLELPAGVDSKERFQSSSLAIDASRIAWSTRRDRSRWHVYTYNAGDRTPTRLTVRASVTPTGPTEPYFVEDTFSGATDPVVSGGRVTWLTWAGSGHALWSWHEGDATSTCLASYADSLYAPEYAACDDKVAWIVGDLELSDDDGGGFRSLETWTPSQSRPEMVLGEDREAEFGFLHVTSSQIAFSGYAEDDSGYDGAYVAELRPIEQRHRADGVR